MIKDTFANKVEADKVEADNQRFLQILSDYLNFEPRLITSKDVESVTETGVSKQTAFAFLLALNFGVDPYGAEREFFNRYFVPSIKELDINDYYNDAYKKYIKFSTKTVNNWQLTTKSYAPFEAFVRDDFIYEQDGRVIPLIGFFDGEYNYPAVLQDGREWMTLLPNEINSQKRYVKEAFGKVVTYGLGLGYYALHVALKDDVERVDVVDISDDVINLFKQNVLPQFPEKARKKINVIKKDAFLFAQGLKDGDYDYIYVDIWHDCQDGAELYPRFKELERFCKTAKYGYWIEDSIKYYLK